MPVSASALTQHPHFQAIVRLVRTQLPTVIVPLALFYGLRASGVDQWFALVVSGIVPLVAIGHRLIASNHLDRLAVFVLFSMVVGTAVSLVEGDPRALLARESWGTAVIGIGFLWSLGRSPVLLTAAAPFLGPGVAAAWHEAWQHDERFRCGIRLVTALWGVGFLLDSALRVVLAYTLPIDLVPIASVALIVVTIAGANALGKAIAGRHLAHST